MTNFSEDTDNCPICRASAKVRVTYQGRDALEYQCQRCGNFSVTGSARSIIRESKWSPRQIANASGWIREHQGIQVSTADKEFLSMMRTPAVAERATKILIELEKRSTNIGQRFDFKFSSTEMMEWIGVSWSINHTEVEYLFINFLLVNEFIHGEESQERGAPKSLSRVFITPRGHGELERMRHGVPDSPIGFCAMWFAPQLIPVWTEAIEPAIKDAGYDAKRIDRVEHNNKIDDEIVAMIRKSRFVVADLTGNRGGVYFEAGFAMGLEIPVVWTIRGGRFHRIRFDNRQYNFIPWSFDALADFKARLQNRIEATLGRGPLR